jgi:hypothetical protein
MGCEQKKKIWLIEINNAIKRKKRVIQQFV